MSTDAVLNKALRELGLTPTEADVYLGTLRATATGPASGYRIARDTGRDPANLGKVMASLVLQGAVRVVQDPPRLYEPVPPEVFTAAVIDRMRARREEALSALADLGSRDSSAPLLLPDVSASLDQARLLVEEAGASVMVHAHPEILAGLREAIAGASRRGCRTRMLCSTPVGGCAGELTLVPGGGDTDGPWLQMVVDGEAWLVAGAGTDGIAGGCWGRQRPAATVMARAMETLRAAGGLRCEMAAAAGASPGKPLEFLVRHDQAPGSDRRSDTKSNGER